MQLHNIIRSYFSLVKDGVVTFVSMHAVLDGDSNTNNREYEEYSKVENDKLKIKNKQLSQGSFFLLVVLTP